jgi:hypothetical protein
MTFASIAENQATEPKNAALRGTKDHRVKVKEITRRPTKRNEISKEIDKEENRKLKSELSKTRTPKIKPRKHDSLSES